MAVIFLIGPRGELVSHTLEARSKSAEFKDITALFDRRGKWVLNVRVGSS